MSRRSSVGSAKKSVNTRVDVKKLLELLTKEKERLIAKAKVDKAEHNKAADKSRTDIEAFLKNRVEHLPAFFAGRGKTIKGRRTDDLERYLTDDMPTVPEYNEQSAAQIVHRYDRLLAQLRASSDTELFLSTSAFEALMNGRSDYCEC